MSKIQEFLLNCRQQKAFSGAAYVIGSASSVCEQGTIGTLRWEGGRPVESDSLWDLASLTKPLVAVALMKLFESGEFFLNDTIPHFLPEYKDSDKRDITLFQLLTHSSGIPGQQPLYHVAATPEEMMTAVLHLPLRFAPGTDVEYTSQGFMIVGRILEKIAGLPLDAAVKELLLAPLNMNNTGFLPPKSVWDHVAATEFCPWRNRMICGEVHDENACVLGGVAGHAGLFSTAGDMASFCRMLLQEGACGEKQYLNPATVRLMVKNHTPAMRLARGLGWQAKDPAGSPAGDLFSSASYGHTGFTGTSIWIDPEADLFAVLLTNRVHPSRSNDSILRIRPVFHNLAYLNFASLKKS